MIPKFRNQNGVFAIIIITKKYVNKNTHTHTHTYIYIYINILLGSKDLESKCIRTSMCNVDKL